MNRSSGPAALIAACAAIFWPGAFIFGFPGVMSPLWQESLGVGRAEIGQTLFFALAAVGLGMFMVGRWQERFGPTVLVLIGGLLSGFNTIMVGRVGSLPLLHLWAFLAGLTSCFIYLPCITVVQQWFPLKRGIVSGLFNMSFAISAAVVSPLFSRLLTSLGYEAMTLVLGLIALAFGVAAAPFLRPPPPSWRPPRAPGLPGPESSLTLVQSLKARSFWGLWLTWALSGAAGIAMVTNAASFGLARGLAMDKAVILLTAFNLTSGLSRVVSGFLSDILGRRSIMSLAFLAAGLAYLWLPRSEGLLLWAFLAGAVGFAFGTMWALSAPLAADCFGMKHFGAIFGLLYTAYGFISGALGPWLSGRLLDLSGGDFHLVFGYLGVLQLITAGLIWTVRPRAVK